jgi:hypothetical protein
MYHYDKQQDDFISNEEMLAQKKEAIDAKKLILKEKTVEKQTQEILDHVESLFDEL